MKKLLLLAILMSSSLVNSHAVIIAEEFFNYTTGSQLTGANGGTGWTAPWVAQADRYEIQATTQSFPGLVSSGANAVSKFDNPSFGNGFSRAFANQTGRVWGSFTVNFAQLPTYFEVGLHETGNNNWSSLFGINGANIFANHNGSGALVNTAFAPALSTTYMMAFTYDSAGATPTTFFIDPTGLGAGLTPSGSLASASFTGTNWGVNPGIGGIKFFAANGLFTIDDVRIGTTWADVSPIPEPSTYALLALGLGALFFLRRRFAA
ncbi:MAG: PEP-CTERM sorting domain-containing protein [Blastochloris sp.]|nr:PEP-CTERM sorting domain-containing protein [Blastochloris sp.]